MASAEKTLKIKNHIDEIVEKNAEHILNLTTEDEVKDWLTSLLWSVVGICKNDSD